jgi:hypothetical protein
MKTEHKQSGSAHVVIVVVLVVALLGALGFIFYQNFIAKKDASDSVATQPDSVTQATSEVTTTTAVSKKEYCTAIEKLCFNYPEDWSVSATQEIGTLDPTTPTMDQVQIKNKAGETYLYMTTGISGIGGTCDPSENVDVTILETHTTGIQGDFLSSGMESVTSSTAYAVEHVERTEKTSSQYTVGMHILNSNDVIKPGTVNWCSIGYGMFRGKTQDGDVKFATSGFGIESTTRTFSSYDDAVKFLNSDDAKTAYDILVSAHYN